MDKGQCELHLDLTDLHKFGFQALCLHFSGLREQMQINGRLGIDHNVEINIDPCITKEISP